MTSFLGIVSWRAWGLYAWLEASFAGDDLGFKPQCVCAHGIGSSSSVHGAQVQLEIHGNDDDVSATVYNQRRIGGGGQPCISDQRVSSWDFSHFWTHLKITFVDILILLPKVATRNENGATCIQRHIDYLQRHFNAWWRLLALKKCVKKSFENDMWRWIIFSLVWSLGEQLCNRWRIGWTVYSSAAWEKSTCGTALCLLYQQAGLGGGQATTVLCQFLFYSLDYKKLKPKHIKNEVPLVSHLRFSGLHCCSSCVSVSFIFLSERKGYHMCVIGWKTMSRWWENVTPIHNWPFCPLWWLCSMPS